MVAVTNTGGPNGPPEPGDLPASEEEESPFREPDQAPLKEGSSEPTDPSVPTHEGRPTAPAHSSRSQRQLLVAAAVVIALLLGAIIVLAVQRNSQPGSTPTAQPPNPQVVRALVIAGACGTPSHDSGSDDVY